MEQFEWRDCRLQADGGYAVLQNDCVRAEFEILEGGLFLRSLQNRVTGFCWQDAQHTKAELYGRCSDPHIVWTAQPTADALSGEKWCVSCIWTEKDRTIEHKIELYPNCAFITGFIECKGKLPQNDNFNEEQHNADGIEQQTVQENTAVSSDALVSIFLPPTHLRWHSVRLVDQTDVHDTLVFEQDGLVYRNEVVMSEANIFSFDALQQQESLLAICHAPITPQNSKHFSLQGNHFVIRKGDWVEQGQQEWLSERWTVGVSDSAQKWSKMRAFYRLGWNAPWQNHALLLSNTWGDRGRDSRICEAFIQKEIETAAELGLDMVQIDDGWQQGTTVNSADPQGGVWKGYYAANSGFWNIHPTRFPRGIVPLVELAAEKNISLGLWFSPDSSNMFENWEKDADVLLHLWKNEGIAAFKLDGVKLRTGKARANYIRFLDKVMQESKGAIILQQDITAEQRLGYLCERQYGTLFVENRYTDFGNYYPYRTLRNLWMLSRYIPAQRMLFEVLNRARNPHRYGQDVLAPINYSQDHLFALILAAQPLFWMELQSLSHQDKMALKQIVEIYRTHRNRLWKSDVVPIGEQPNGFSATGFLFEPSGSEKEGYALFLCETYPAKSFVYRQLPANADWTFLAGEKLEKILSQDDGVLVRFKKEQSYAFYHWKLREI